MIDTSKYDGHTPGPWEWFLERIIQADDAVGNEGWVPIAIMDSTEGDYKKEDARLIADAPRLFEEVKRLYEMMDVLASFDIVKNVEQGFTQREWVELVESAKRGEEE